MIKIPKQLKLPNTFKHTMLYDVSIALMKGVSLIMLPFFAHYLSPTDFGKLEVLSSLVGMGLEDFLYRFAGQVKPI